MKLRHPLSRTTSLIALTMALSFPAWAGAQENSSRGATVDALSRVRALYESADYEQALQLLDSIKGQTATSEVSAYQVFCLVALGRKDEARTAIESIVRVDPLYRPTEGQVSPRIRSFFDDVRKPLLPDVIRQVYAKAKTSFDQKDWAPALADFNRVIAVIDELGTADPGASDIRTLAAGFRDLAKVALQPPPPPPAATPTPTPTPVNKIYGDADPGIARPMPISKRMPEWRPNTIEARMEFAGQLDVVVSENGTVLSAVLVKSVNPRYDGPLLEAAKTWTFQPAFKDGKPVKYLYSMAVRLANK